MINIKTAFALIAAISLALIGATSAGEKPYRAVGKILHVTDSMITLRTSTQDLEVTRDAKTKVTGELSHSAMATVSYIKVSGKPYATEITVGAAKK